MKEKLKGPGALNPMKAAQGHAGGALPKRFYKEAAAVRADALKAVESLDQVARRSNLGGPRMVSTGLASAGVWASVKDSLLGFFGYAGDAGKRAAADVLNVANQMSPDDMADAFADVPPGLTGGARDFDELAEKLSSGALAANAAQIRSALWRNTSFYGAAQGACDCGRPELSTAHKEGAELATRGVDLNVTVVKTVLGNVFPDITTGIDYADKASEWAEYARDVYVNPLGTAEAGARDTIAERIKARIQSDLEKCCPGLDGDLVEEAAGAIAKGVLDTVPEVFAATPAATPVATAEPTSTPTAPLTSTPSATSEPISTAAATATPTETPPQPTPTPSAEAPTPTPTPTPSAEDPTPTPTPGAEAPTPTPSATATPTPTPTAATVSNFAGSWTSAGTCDNPDAPHRWTVTLTQTGSSVSGTITFHNCPGGGRAAYAVSGTATSAATVTLSGSKTVSLGALGASTPGSGTFTLAPSGPPSPNYAP